MEGYEETQSSPESSTDWEAGTAETPVARKDYSRSSPRPYVLAGADDETVSDLISLGRDAQARPYASLSSE
jgi:hypothetical protein